MEDVGEGDLREIGHSYFLTTTEMEVLNERHDISLVSFGVSLNVATESNSQISFHQISRSTGERTRHQLQTLN